MMVRESSLVVVLRDEFFFQVGILVGGFHVHVVGQGRLAAVHAGER